MINHVRTLLQNKAASDNAGVYVDPEFTPIQVPDVVELIWAAFGDSSPSDNLVSQIMQMLHSTELDTHVRRSDPRITYPAYFADTFVSCNLAEAVPTLHMVLTEDQETMLFGDYSQEPNSTWYNLWKRHEQLPYKLGGLMLAVADCMERSRECLTHQ